MKTIIKYGFLLLCSLCLFACGDSGGGDGVVVPNEGLVLSVDSDSILQITGQAVFTVTLNGNDVTSNAKIILESTKELLAGTSFTTRTVGEYTFYAQAYGVYSNKVKVTVYGKPVKMFQKNVLFQGLTSTTCTQCPMYHDVVKAQAKRYPGRVYCIEYHGTFQSKYPDPYASDYTKALQEEYGQVGVYGPVLVDSRGFLNPDNLSNVIQAMNMPGNYGIALKTTLSGNQVTVDVRLKTKKQTNETCRLAVAVVEDGLIDRQMDKAGEWMENYVHNDVIRYYFTDILGEEIKSGSFSSQELTKTYTWSGIPVEYDKAKLKVIAYLLIQEKDRMWVENSAGVAMGGSIDFQDVDYVEN